MRYILLLSILFIFNCQSFNRYSVDNLSNISEIKTKTILLKPVVVDISGKGLYSKLSYEYEQKVLNNLEDISSTVFKTYMFGGKILSKSETRNLLFKFDKKELFTRVLSRKREFDKNHGYLLDENDKKILSDFSKNSKVSMVIVPIDISIHKTVGDKDRDKLSVLYNVSVQYQIWDISTQMLIFKDKFTDSFNERIKKKDLENTENFKKFLELFYKKLTSKIKNGDKK